MTLYIFGTGGGALQCLQDGEWRTEHGGIVTPFIKFIVDDKYFVGKFTNICGSEYGVYEDYEKPITDDDFGHISAFNIEYKKRIVKENPKVKWLNCFSERFDRFNGVSIGHGVRIASYVHVDSTAVIGNHVKINTHSVVSHDCTVGDFSYISHHVTLTSNVHIGKGCYIFEGTTIIPGVTIGENTVIGAGSVVTRNIPANVVAFGTPCRVKEELAATLCSQEIMLEKFKNINLKVRGAGND